MEGAISPARNRSASCRQRIVRYSRLESFSVKVEKDGDLTYVLPLGFLDTHTSPMLENVLKELVTKRNFNVVLDCSGLNYISSSGMGVLMGALQEFRAEHGDVKVTGLSHKVYQTFELLGFTKLFEIYQTRREAVAAFRSA